MTTRVLRALLAATIVGGGVTACGSPGGGERETTAFRASRLAGTETPDFNGIWQAMTTANWDILDHQADAGLLTKVGGAWAVQPEGRGIVEGNEIPYKEEARTRQTSNFQNPVPSWMGWSNGRWEGDTLVVEVTSQNGNSWLDRVGNYATDTLKVTERYTLRDADHLMYEATLEDPAVFTRPFKISFPLYRRIEANTDLGEMKCVEFVEDYLYGSLRKKSK